jgi:hypothetical protein
MRTFCILRSLLSRRPAYSRSRRGVLCVLAFTGVLIAAQGRQAVAQESAEALAAAAQNPIASMSSLPFQNNTYFGAGPNHDKTANVLNIQPVLPFSAGEWNIISRTIMPLIYVPSISEVGDDAVAGGVEDAAPMRRDQFVDDDTASFQPG